MNTKLIVNKTTKLMLAGLVVMQLFDVLSTNAALAHGAVEANPAMQVAMAKLGSYYWLVKLIPAGLAAYYAATVVNFKLYQTVVISVLFKLYLVIVLNNIFQWV